MLNEIVSKKEDEENSAFKFLQKKRNYVLKKI